VDGEVKKGLWQIKFVEGRKLLRKLTSEKQRERLKRVKSGLVNPSPPLTGSHGQRGHRSDFMVEGGERLERGGIKGQHNQNN